MNLNLKKTWLKLKSMGFYPEFPTYEAYCAAQKARGVVDLNEKPKVGMMNPQLAQLEKDARAYDEAHGITGMPDELPF